jgi:hypothetical protein
MAHRIVRRLLIFSILLLGGCSRQSSPLPLPEESESFPALGELTDNWHEIKRSVHRESCDLQWSGRIQQITRALDERASLLSQGHEEESPPAESPATPRVQTPLLPQAQSPAVPSTRSMGPLSVTRSSPVQAPISPHWHSWTRSWQNAHTLYERLVSQGIESSTEWTQLATLAQALIFDDRRRVVDQVNFGLNHEALPLVQLLNRNVQDCLALAHCSRPHWSAGIPEFARSVPLYATFFAGFENSALEDSSRRTILEGFQRRLAQDLLRLNFSRNPDIRRLNADTWEVPLYFGSLPATAVATFVDIVESAWTSGTQSVRVRWRDISPLAFQILMLPDDVGGRAHVSWTPFRHMRLYPEVSEQVVAHEFGHILGFKDNYFTFWNSTTCVYTLEQLDSDIMSRPTTGSVGPAHWSELDAQYPL